MGTEIALILRQDIEDSFAPWQLVAEVGRKNGMSAREHAASQLLIALGIPVKHFVGNLERLEIGEWVYKIHSGPIHYGDLTDLHGHSLSR